MFRILFLAFLLVPLAEIWVFAQVGSAFGFGTTFLGIIAVSVIGAWLVKQEGLGAWHRAQQRISKGEAPTDEIITGVLILMAGALMLTPGFLTDAFGLTLLFPPTRAVYRRSIRKRIDRGQFVVRTVGNFTGFRGFGSTPPDPGRPADGVWDVDGWEEPPERPPLP